MAFFNVELTWDVEEGVPVDLIVSGDFAQSRGNVNRGHPDTWCAPWIELDVRRVENTQGCELPDAVVKILTADDNFLSAVEDRVTR